MLCILFRKHAILFTTFYHIYICMHIYTHILYIVYNVNGGYLYLVGIQAIIKFFWLTSFVSNKCVLTIKKEQLLILYVTHVMLHIRMLHINNSP
jgi:hypothetical protein